MARMRGAGAFTIRRLVLSRPGVWQGNCLMGKVSGRYTSVGFVRKFTKLKHRAIALTNHRALTVCREAV